MAQTKFFPYVIVSSYSQNTASAESETNAQLGLCCCEYTDRNNVRSHILACCCNCEDFDLVITNLICCQRIDRRNRNGMLLTFQDRLRLPWRGGAKQISLEAIIPALALPVVIGIGGINAYTAIVMLLACIAFIGYAYIQAQRSLSHTHFFFMWLFWSAVYLIVTFEITVPKMELLPEENIALVLLAAATIFCLYKTKVRAVMNCASQLPSTDATVLSDNNEVGVEDETDSKTALLMDTDDIEQSEFCSICRKHMTPWCGISHCAVCGFCVLRRDHHSFWLDICIGEWNHCYYVAGLFFAELTLLLGANLTMTAACHPFMIFRVFGITIMLPDDCREAFDQYEFGIGFVIAAYALIIATYVLAVLTRQLFLISRGLTLADCQRGKRNKQKTIWANWRAFFHKRSV